MASDARMPTAKERASIRDAHRQMIAARRRADAVTRPDGCDSLGHPGIAAANLGGSLGGRAVALLDSLEAVEAERDEAVRERDEARAEAEKLRETLASVGVPLEALRLANRDVPGWLSREAERAIVEATDAIRGVLSGGGGQ